MEIFDFEGIKNAINECTKMVTIQRSKGYATRPTLSIDRIEELIRFIKDIRPDLICMVDNCYGEFVEDREPLEVGADLMVGSLIKNLGGGLTPIGGYIVGEKRMCGTSILSPDFTRSWKRSGCNLRRKSYVLSRVIYVTDCCGKCFKKCNICGKCL